MEPAKSRAERVKEAVQMCKQVQKMGLLSNSRFAEQFKGAYRAFVTDGTTATLRCPVDVGAHVEVVFSNTRQSGIAVGMMPSTPRPGQIL